MSHPKQQHGGLSARLPLTTSDFETRARELGRLLPLWPHDLADRSLAGRRRIVKLLERALRAERVRGRAGHWAYDLARHVALHRAWQAEREHLKALIHARPQKPFEEKRR